MKKILLIIIALTACNAGAQGGAKIGNNAAVIDGSTLFELESTTKGFRPPWMTSVQMNAIVSPPKGLLVYCTDCAPISLWHFNGTTWGPVGGVPVPTVVANCTGFEGAFASGVLLTGASYKVTLTNNSFFPVNNIGLATNDLALTGITGVSVSGILVNGTPAASVSLLAGGSATITYQLLGTPASTGTIKGTWSKITLSCEAEKPVGTLSSLLATNYCIGAALNGTYINGVLMNAGNTFTVTLTNTSGFVLNGLAAPATTNLALTGVTGLSVLSVVPNAAFNLAVNEAKLFTYTISGTPASAGTLTAKWNYSGLTECEKTKTVTNGSATFASLPMTKNVISATNAAPVVNIQGVINNGANKITFSVPYTAGAGSYPAYSSSLVLVNGEGDTNNLSITYPAGTFSTTGNLIVTVVVDGDGSFNVTKQAFGVMQNIVTFPLMLNGSSLGNLVINASGGIPDRRFGEITTQGGIAGTYHNNVYLPITSPSGRIWLNNNLGADYSDVTNPNFNPLQQATSATDYKAYGSQYQWGRYSDGHELINWGAGGIGTSVNGTTTALSSTDTPPNNMFILCTTPSSSDWRWPQNNALWQGVSGTNNPCPVGYRLPTGAEYTIERAALGITNLTTAYNSILKITAAGYRSNATQAFSMVNTVGFYWSSTVNGIYVLEPSFDASTGNPNGNRGETVAVRCISE